jgi:hypothetical protein
MQIRECKLQVRQHLNMFRSIERTLTLDLAVRRPRFIV